MRGWYNCSTPEDGECWLRHPDGREYNIHTDYENDAPIGIDRYYTLEVSNASINADGIAFEEAKVFDNSYPGPWIQACWGDVRTKLHNHFYIIISQAHNLCALQRIHITIVNKLKYYGTSVHWHGIRQNQTMHMDGVNGITQCPIAPNDNFTYIWNTTQYGSSWYHSHYSVQYADGLQGPIVSISLRGPLGPRLCA